LELTLKRPSGPCSKGESRRISANVQASDFIDGPNNVIKGSRISDGVLKALVCGMLSSSAGEKYSLPKPRSAVSSIDARDRDRPLALLDRDLTRVGETAGDME
jgi:hypothetical protein